MVLRIWPEYDTGKPTQITQDASEDFVLRVSPYLKGDPGDAATQFIHTQSVPSDTWTVNHNKGYRPLAIAYSVGWVEIEAQIVHVSENQLTVNLNAPQAGYVLC